MKLIMAGLMLLVSSPAGRHPHQDAEVCVILGDVITCGGGR